MTQQPEPPRDDGWMAETCGRADAFDGRKMRGMVLFRHDTPQAPEMRELYRTAYEKTWQAIMDDANHGRSAKRHDVPDSDRYAAECLLRGVDSLEALEALHGRDAARRLNREVTSEQVAASHDDRVRLAYDLRSKEDVDAEFEEALRNFGRPVPKEEEHVELPTIGKLWLKFARDVYGGPLPEGAEIVADVLEDLRAGRNPGGTLQPFDADLLNDKMQKCLVKLEAQQKEIDALRSRLGTEERIRRDQHEREKSAAGLTLVEQHEDLARRVGIVEARAQRNADNVYRNAAAASGDERKLRKLRRKVRKLERGRR